ncbi:MAG TPA: tetratricopeptide repeat protein [Chlorobaculum sp.]|nr:tetratricopeptide repeat protein [Chlorobaculum sp.]
MFKVVCILSLFASMVPDASARQGVLSRGDGRSSEERAGPAPSLKAGAMPEYVRGLFLAMKGDFQGAIESFRKVEGVRPDEPALHYSISRAYYSLAVLDSARVHGETAVKLDPGNSYYARYLARVAHDMQDYDRAADLYGKVALSDSRRIDMMYLQALEYLAGNHPEQALEVIEKVVQIDPFNDEALSQALLLQIRLKRYQEAIVTLKQLIRQSDDDAKLQLTLGDLYAQNGQDDLALATYKALISADRHFYPAWIAMFDYYIRAGRLADYKRELSAFLELRPSSDDTFIDVARIYLVRSEKDSLYVEPAHHLVDEIIARHPRDTRIYLLKGIYEMRRDKGQEAMACFRKAILLDSGNVTAWEYLIMTQLDLAENRKAFDLLAKAKKRLPRHMARWKTIEGYALLHGGSPKRAAAVLETVVRANPPIRDQELLVQANANLAMAYDALGRKKSCREAYLRVLELDAHNTLAMNNLAYLLAEEGARLPKALKLAENAVMLEPDNGVFLDTLGWVHYRLGNYDLAREMIEKSLATGIEEAEIYQHLGQVYEKLGNPEKAREMFEKSKAGKSKASK